MHEPALGRSAVSRLGMDGLASGRDRAATCAWSPTTTATVRAIDAQVWGQAFEAPVWADEVEVITQRLVGEKHLKLTLRHGGLVRDAIWFGRSEPLPSCVRLAYRLSVDEYNGRQRVQMIVEAAG